MRVLTLAVFCLLVACAPNDNNNTGGTVSADNAAAPNPNRKNTPNNTGGSQDQRPTTRKSISNMSGSAIKKKFKVAVIDATFDGAVLKYNGFYHAYTDANGMETLHGHFQFYTEISEPATDLYYKSFYRGSFQDGLKHGTFTNQYGEYEGGGGGFIHYENGSCVSGFYELAGDGFSMYKGDLSGKCDFNTLIDLTVDVGDDYGQETEPQNSIKGTRASASSSLPPSKQGNYKPSNVLDNDPSTVWVEGAAGLGQGEWIQLDFLKTNVSAIYFRNGYSRIANNNGAWHKENRFYQNSRAKNLLLTFSDGSSERIELLDHEMPQEFSFRSRSASSVKISIEDAYAGDKWEDVCISEIKLLK